jgi:hypothetical protein
MHESVPLAKTNQHPVRGACTVARGFAPIAALWRMLMRRLRPEYQPELHYMRGPGPKWHERNSRP